MKILPGRAHKHLRGRGHRLLQDLMIEVRKEAGYTGQREWAQHLGWQKSVVERIEAGHQIPTYLQVRDWVLGAGMTFSAFNRRFETRMRQSP